ncbi:MAG: hypothetical protein HC893_05930 [Chloroflexaceae bacterium]|nr:hypothetical protein [Chloroflexaceae bacterium]
MPDGSQITQASGPLFFEPEQLGVYTLEEYRDDELEARLRYTVNLFAPEESRIVPQDALAVAQTGGIQSAITPRDQEGRQEFWRWLAAVALLVLLIEWLVYQRSGLVALFERLRGRPHDTAGQRPARSR